ncbi:SLAM family member 9-like isoform X2 [Xyrauchen texanus]|uniref:SLAM family member 9-like isoform X2 n=1 Tax=Xyrauchen texanus TaxID=154827 RepID=UPI0022420673|nr:SLAM family member 9-like isoform X2 [Xyrauchen texanus]
MFHTWLLLCLFLWHVVGVFDVDPDKVKSVSVMEGDSVTLHTDLTQIQDGDEIDWRIIPEHIRIARIKRKIFNTYDDVLDGRFRGRLYLNHQTGDLTITNITTEHTGLYQLNIITGKKTTNYFSVTVSARLPVPVIIRDSSQYSSSSKCVLVCSVVNVTQVTLSWYKGNSLLSSISVSDLNRSLSLHLECVDDSYSCVVNNPIRNQTKHLNITEVCQPCSDFSWLIKDYLLGCGCGFTEAVIRLVVSGLVGVAAVVVLVYDIRSKSVGQKTREQTSSLK